MKYKMVCIDLDGTLLNKKHEVSDYNVNTINKVRDLGVIIAVVTGRRPKSAYQYTEKIGLNIPIISYNGGMIANTKTKEIIKTSFLDKEYATKVIELWVKTGAPVFAYDNTFDDPDVYHQNYSDHYQIQGYLTKEGKAVKSVESLTSVLDFNPVCIKTFGYAEDVEECYKHFDLLNRDDVIWLKTKGPNNTAYLEVYPVAAKKSYGLKWLSEHFGVKQHEILAIGDNLNDLDMLEWAGCGVAMGNALPEVKEVADMVTDTCDNDGVGKALEKIFLC